MVSKNTIKRITRLAQKKYRHREGHFVAEGVKVINELLASTFELVELYTEDVSTYAKTISHSPHSTFEEVTASELKKISFLKSPQKAVAIFKIPQPQALDRSGLTLVLDDIRDPGNLGTIIRLCDWFGIKQLVCSRETVDCYNPKVVQATMGSLTRVAIMYTDITNYLSQDTRAIYGTFMDGTSIYSQKLPETGIIIMGNEANGISQEVENTVTHRVAIPRFGNTQVTESLNVATAAAICLSEFKRK